MSVDPDETQTQAAYYYAGDDPVTGRDGTGLYYTPPIILPSASGGCANGAVACGVYNRNAAVRYAQEYVYTTNPDYLDLGGVGIGGDCTNFASQVLVAGGVFEVTAPGGNRTSINSWFFRWANNAPGGRPIYSDSFTVSQDLYDHLVKATWLGRVVPLTALQPGDLIFYKLEGSSVFNHTTVVVQAGPNANNIRVDQHSPGLNLTLAKSEHDASVEGGTAIVGVHIDFTASNPV